MKRSKRLDSATFAIFVVITVVLFFPGVLFAKSDFRQWIDTFALDAEKEGITRAVYFRAFENVNSPDATVLKKAAYQPEFTTKIWDYLDTRVNRLSIERGRAKQSQYGETLMNLAAQFGVRPSVLLAIWSMETNYGAILARTDRLHYVPRALATLAYGDKKRKKFGRSQLIASLKILQQGDTDEKGLLGSWAGAMGHTQFIPTSYLAYGVDMDGDGRRDIWNSIPDALATAANLLKRNKWQPKKTWGYEVTSPDNLGKHFVGKTMKLREWQQLGYRRVKGKTFPRPDDKAVLKMPAGIHGPAFLVLKNFYVLKRYNNSDYYALAVGLLSDEIAGYGGLVQKWPRPEGALSMDEKFELQGLLKQKGYYTGEVDGYIGTGTGKAIKAYQNEIGVKPTGKVSVELLKKMRIR